MEVVIAELRTLHAGGESVNRAVLIAHGRTALVSAVERYCGSFARAHKLAGIEVVPSRPTWDAKRVVAEIRRLHSQGVTMNSQQLIATGHAGLVTAATKHLGSWRKAIAQAGVPAFKRGRWKTWEATSDKLRECHAAAIVMSTASMREHDLRDLIEAAKQFAGTWNKALAKAGVPLVMEYERWTEADVRAGIRLLDAGGVPLGSNIAIARGQRKLVKAAARHFGSWKAACYASVPDYRPLMTSWTEARVLREIRKRHRAGAPMRSTQVQREQPTLTAAARRLGLDWVDACRSVGVPDESLARNVPPTRTRWTKQLIVERLRGAAHDGASLVVKSFPSALVQAAEKAFGSWETAMSAADLADRYAGDRSAAIAARLGGAYATRRTR